MKSLLGASLSLALAALFATSASAADLPEVKLSAGNKVPQCATPERLTDYLKSRNPRLDPRFEDIAALYKKHGEALAIRWDIAFFQMILETGALRYTGDVRADQNNFAGLGASGGGARGERFPDISTGVKAHLQHLLMYAGEHIDDPVADRTRKVQEWGVLTDWQKSIDGPMTYTLVAKQWAPTSRNYVRDVTTITDGFYSGYCAGADADQGIQEASNDEPPAKAKTTVAALDTPAADETPTSQPAAKVTGADIAKRNIEEERKQGGTLKSLGAGMLASVDTTKASAEPQKQPNNQAAEDSPPVTLLNAKQDSEPAAAPPAASDNKQATAKPDQKKAKEGTKTAAKTTPASDSGKGASVQTASIGSAATQLKIPPAKGGKCKVFTASYGGQRAVIIKANGDGQTNYTVLDVTDANEKREIDAYIAAYAKGGEKVGAFANQTKALTKAFELCPEG
ncbi:MAG: hypothetical protein ACK4TP_04430 [Hyphomicrobium sp.]|jgi:hypothetical protein